MLMTQRSEGWRELIDPNQWTCSSVKRVQGMSVYRVPLCVDRTALYSKREITHQKSPIEYDAVAISSHSSFLSCEFLQAI